MVLNIDQEKQAASYIDSQDYKEIVTLITNLSDQNDDRYSETLEIVSDIGKANKLDINIIRKLAEIYEINRSAPAVALASAYEALHQQAIGMLNNLSHNVRDHLSKIEQTLKENKTLEQQDQIHAIYNSFTASEIQDQITKTKTALEPGVLSNNLDHDLVNELAVLRAAYQLSNQQNLDTNEDCARIKSYQETEAVRAVSIYEGLDLLELFHKLYLASLIPGQQDSKNTQIDYLNQHKLMSKQNPTSVAKQDLGALSSIDQITAQEKILAQVAKRLQAKDIIEPEDIMYTDDLNYPVGIDTYLRQSRVDDQDSLNYRHYLFDLQGVGAQTCNYIISISRTNENMKVVSGAYDYIQYCNGRPIIMLSHNAGYSALADYDNIQSTIQIANYDFSLLQPTTPAAQPLVEKVETSPKKKKASAKKSAEQKPPKAKTKSTPVQNKEKAQKHKEVLQKHIELLKKNKANK